MKRRLEPVLLAALLAAGCSGAARGPVSLAEASRETVIVAHPPAWTKGRIAAGGSYLIPYANNPDVVVTAATPLDLDTALAGLTDAHLEPGFMAGVRYSWDFSETLTVSLSASYYQADTTVEYQIETPPMSGTYELDQLVGVPVHLDFEFGLYSTTMPARWFFGVGGGYIWYGEPDEQGLVEAPEDEPLAVATTGVEFFGVYNVDVRLEAGHVWLFENKRHQLTTGLSVSYSF